MHSASYSRWNLSAAISFKPMSDYFYQSSSTRYSYRGGNSRSGLACGIFCVRLYYSFSGTYWDIGAALSFK